MHELGFEDRLRRKIPTNHPLVAWVVQYAGDLLSKYFIEHDGKTPIQRLTGKVAREEILEMGESVLYRSYKDADGKLAARWHDGGLDWENVGQPGVCYRHGGRSGDMQGGSKETSR